MMDYAMNEKLDYEDNNKGKKKDAMEVDNLNDDYDTIDALGKSANIYCYRCGGQGHIAAKCASLEPVKGGKGQGKGKGG